MWFYLRKYRRYYRTGCYSPGGADDAYAQVLALEGAAVRGVWYRQTRPVISRSRHADRIHPILGDKYAVVRAVV